MNYSTNWKKAIKIGDDDFEDKTVIPITPGGEIGKDKKDKDLFRKIFKEVVKFNIGDKVQRLSDGKLGAVIDQNQYSIEVVFADGKSVKYDFDSANEELTKILPKE